MQHAEVRTEMKVVCYSVDQCWGEEEEAVKEEKGARRGEGMRVTWVRRLAFLEVGIDGR